MTKPYTEQLAEWVKQKKSTKRDKNLVAFLAIRDDVKAAIEAGFSVKTVWENMHESKRVDFGYDTFLNYVNRHIREPQPDKSMAPTNQKPTTEESIEQMSKAEQSKASTKSTKPVVLPTFTYNPIPNIEELI